MMRAMSLDDTTIAAIATAPGASGVAVVRISGPLALAVADRVVRGSGPPPSLRRPGTFHHAHLADPHTGAILDDGLVLVFRAPHSYTGEDSVELQGHGGQVPARRLLEAVLAAGARPAEAGEFTRRAFLNGRLDLTQAEAVLDLISARTERAAAAAQAQLDGALGQRLTALYERLATLCADLEALLDFDESDVPESLLHTLDAQLTDLHAKIDRQLATWREGHLLREGALVVISGAPNVGKSSLLNALLGRARAIVSATPGTTRDTLEEGLALEGLPLRLVDTAGLREVACPIEREGVARARELLEQADLHLHLIEAGSLLASQLAAAPAGLPRDRTLLVVNKCDLVPASPDLAPLAGWTVVPISARVGTGLDRLRQALVQALGAAPAGAHEVGISSRHRAELQLTSGRIEAARAMLAEGPAGIVLAAGALRDGAEALGRITGRVYSDELLDRIFSRFCVGK